MSLFKLLCPLLVVIESEDKGGMNSTRRAWAIPVVAIVAVFGVSSPAASAVDQAAPPSVPKSVAGAAADDRTSRMERFLKEQEERRFASEAEKRVSAYTPFLMELGLTEDQIRTVLNGLDRLLLGAVRAGDPRQEFVIARAKYDGDMQALLGDPGFAEYEAYELAKPYQSEKQNPEYALFLSKQGLKPDQVQATLGRLAELAKRELKAAGPMQELRVARSDYLSDMKSMLGDTRFAKYEAFERAKPYRYELDFIGEYAAKQGAKVDPKFRNRLVELLGEFQLHTGESWDGPYDPLPRPMAGTRPILALNNEKTSRISSGISKLSAKASAELPPELLSLVQGYYAMKLQEFAESRAFLSMTREERRAKIEREMEELRLRRKAKQGNPIPDL